ncbi:Canalicular multispecific organic anion transporter 2 [Chytriomyces hyalinus]|nr:Canalicular multispecific organic anion transporter 2 [Chytriomyces hyalinus]
MSLNSNTAVKLFVGHVEQLIRRGGKSPLEEQDLPNLPLAQRIATHSRVFDKLAELVSHHVRTNGALAHRPNLARWLAWYFAPQLLLMSVLKGIALACTLCTPYLLVPQVLMLINPYSVGPPPFTSSTVLMGFILFGVQCLSAVCSNAAEVVGIEIQTGSAAVLGDAVFKKALRLSLAARTEYAPDKILTLISSDKDQIGILLRNSAEFWCIPVHLAVAVTLLGLLLGHAVWAAVGTIVFFTGIQVYFGSRIGAAAYKYMGSMDKRVQVIREFVYGIKFVKLSATEDFFISAISKAREAQKAALWSYMASLLGITSSIVLQQMLIPVFSFLLFAGLGGDVNGTKLFASFGLFESLLDPLLNIPTVVQYFTQAQVSYKRIEDILFAAEGNSATPQGSAPKKSASEAISVSNCEWTSGDFSLRDVSFQVSGGCLVAIVGAVGSGKSALLSALAQNNDSGAGLAQVKGQVSVRGRVALCAQTPWLQSGTLAECIRFAPDSSPDDVGLDPVLLAADRSILSRDLETLPDGIHTRIGEKGVELSGGQRARVALARALYSDADVYLLDDPLAALDAHVGKRVFQETIKRVLKDKTVLLATHQLHLLPETDYVIVLGGGCVVEQGSFNELMARQGGSLVDMMKNYQYDQVDDVSNQDDDNQSDEVTDIPKVSLPESGFMQVVTERDSKHGTRLEDRITGKNANESSSSGKTLTPEPGSLQVVTEKSKSKQDSGAEERVTGTVTFSTVTSYFVAGGGVLFVLMLTLLCLMFMASSVLSQLSLSWWSVRQFNWSTTDYLLFYGLSGVFSAIAMIGLNFVLCFGSYKAAVHYHQAAVRGIAYSTLSFFESQPAGRIINRFSTDIRALDLGFVGNWISVFLFLVQVVAAIIIISISNPILLAQFAVLGALFWVLYRYFQKTYRELKRLSAIMKSPLLAHVSETLNGLLTIVAFGRVDACILVEQRKLDDSMKAMLLLDTTKVWIRLRLQLMSSTIILALILLAPLKIVETGTISISLVYAISLSNLIIGALMALSVVEASFSSVERLNHYSQKLPQEPSHHLPLDSTLTNWPTTGQITFKNLEMRYDSRPETAVIKNLSVQIEAGQKVGIVGRTGSGKSTLVSALFRTMELTNGAIEIDGRDIAHVGLHALRSSLEMIPQEPILFNGTLRSNLDMSAQYTDSQLWDALDLVGMKNMVADSKDQLDMRVTEGGDNMSMGQRQLLCLAKAILAKPKILIMDEATAAVDGEADQKIQEVLFRDFKDATVISIAHRLNTIARFDKVLVLAGGELKEFDAPHVLLGRPESEFSQLVDATGGSNAALIRELAHKRFLESSSVI